MSKAPPVKPQTYCIVTYGCQMNDNDSEIMSGILEAKGLRRVDSEAEADVVLVNTCVVRDGAEERAVGRLSQMTPRSRRRGGKIIGVTGCMAQRDGEAALARLPGLDMVVGTRDLFRIGELVDRAMESGVQVVSVGDVDKPVFLREEPVRRKHSLKALVTVMVGCNNFCSFCIVPKTRGREVSRPVGEIVDEVRRLADQGYVEVQLLGQNVNSYGHDGADFADLLEAINGVDGIRRIRFITSHPKDCSDRLVDAVASLDKVCDSFHLPAQAGSNRVLRRMKRFYTREHYLELLARVRDRIPGAAITTDLIVGFPDETEGDFEETYELLEAARWDSAFIFMYSPREGTKAAQWADSIPLEQKKHRLQRCLGRQEQISGEVNRALVGSTVEVLVESVSKRSTEEMVGRTTGDKSVIFRGGMEVLGRLVKVRVTGAHPHTLFGVAVEG
jgi:tRNA-2-methylthio-N6-dimethylallyladenosine synthase